MSISKKEAKEAAILAKMEELRAKEVDDEIEKVARRRLLAEKKAKEKQEMKDYQAKMKQYQDNWTPHKNPLKCKRWSFEKWVGAERITYFRNGFYDVWEIGYNNKRGVYLGAYDGHSITKGYSALKDEAYRLYNATWMPPVNPLNVKRWIYEGRECFRDASYNVWEIDNGVCGRFMGITDGGCIKVCYGSEVRNGEHHDEEL